MVEAPAVYDPAPDETVSETVIRALADSMDTEPCEMDVRLYDAIDPDALDELFAASGTADRGRVSFAVADRRVVVDESRRVSISAAPGTDRGDERSHQSSAPLRGAAFPWRLVFGGADGPSRANE